MSEYPTRIGEHEVSVKDDELFVRFVGSYSPVEARQVLGLVERLLAEQGRLFFLMDVADSETPLPASAVLVRSRERGHSGRRPPDPVHIASLRPPLPDCQDPMHRPYAPAPRRSGNRSQKLSFGQLTSAPAWRLTAGRGALVNAAGAARTRSRGIDELTASFAARRRRLGARDGAASAARPGRTRELAQARNRILAHRERGAPAAGATARHPGGAVCSNLAGSDAEPIDILHHAARALAGWEDAACKRLGAAMAGLIRAPRLAVLLDPIDVVGDRIAIDGRGTLLSCRGCAACAAALRVEAAVVRRLTGQRRDRRARLRIRGDQAADQQHRSDERLAQHSGSIS